MHAAERAAYSLTNMHLLARSHCRQICELTDCVRILQGSMPGLAKEAEHRLH